jgi:hypothetical protein
MFLIKFIITITTTITMCLHYNRTTTLQHFILAPKLLQTTYQPTLLSYLFTLQIHYICCSRPPRATPLSTTSPIVILLQLRPYITKPSSPPRLRPAVAANVQHAASRGECAAIWLAPSGGQDM